MRLLLWQSNGVRRLVSHLHVQLAARGGDGQAAVSQLAREVEGLAHRLL
jgi:hypothetical protein